MTRRDPEEVQVVCSECNGYLWSISTSDAPAKAAEEGFHMIRCPMIKDPMGECTGRPRRS